MESESAEHHFRQLQMSNCALTYLTGGPVRCV